MTPTELEQIQYEYIRNENHGTPAGYRKCREIALENFWAVLSTAIDLLKPAKAKPTTMAGHYPAGFTTNEPCSHCLEASEKAEKIISQIDTAIGMITVPSEVSITVREAKDLLLDSSTELGEIFEV